MPQRPDERISSRQNRWFRRFLAAAEHHDHEILLEGPKAIADAIARGWRPVAFALGPGADPPLPGIPALLLAPALLRELTDTRHPQGLLALFERPQASLEAALARVPPLVVVLDAIQDPGNVGTIIRLAAAFDATCVVAIDGTADPFAPKALRASAGAALTLPIVRAGRAELLRSLRARSIPLFAATAGGEPLRIAPPAALALGNEGGGLSDEVLAAARPVGIPISGAVESLNVAAAAAILLHRIFAGE